MNQPWTRRQFVTAALASSGAAVLASRMNRTFAAETAPIRLALICDTHTTRGTTEDQPEYKPHFERVIAEVNAARPDWVLHGGDLTQSAKPEEITDFQEQARALQAPLDWVYGNHDVGAKHTDGGKGGITEARLERIEKAFGPSFWEKTRSGIRVVAINTSLINSGFAREAEQWEFLEGAFRAPADKPTLLLLHYPPFTKTPDEAEDPYWNLAPTPRERLLDLVKKGGVKAMLSGHLHYPLNVQYGDIPLVVGPAVSFGLPRAKQPVGWVEITIGPNGKFESELRYLK